MPFHLPAGTSGIFNWLKSRVSLSAAERLRDLRSTFNRRMELKNWLSALEKSTYPSIPESGTAEQCPPRVYEQLTDISAELTDDKIIEIRHLFGKEIEDAVHDLCSALYDQMKAVNELTVPTSLMAQSPHFKPRERLYSEYRQTGKMLHHRFCTVRDLMACDLERTS